MITNIKDGKDSVIRVQTKNLSINIQYKRETNISTESILFDCYFHHLKTDVFPKKSKITYDFNYISLTLRVIRQK